MLLGVMIATTAWCAIGCLVALVWTDRVAAVLAPEMDPVMAVRVFRFVGGVGLLIISFTIVLWVQQAT
jgi:hypothetical protein